jgi:hypothetical protein
MVLRYVRKCIAIVAVTAYVGLAVGGHALHDVTCDHDHAAHAAATPESATQSAHHGHHHGHGHHHHHHGPMHKTAQTKANKTSLPHSDHDHAPQPRHDHDCLICHFTALNMAIVADAAELPEAPRDAVSVATAAPLQTVYQPYGGNPRAPPA